MIKEATRWMLLSTLAFTCMNVAVKECFPIPIAEIIAVRAIIQILFGFYKTKGINSINKFLPQLLLRGFIGSIGLFCFYYTITNIHLGTAMLIHALAPIITTIIAFFIFKEKVFKIQWFWFSCIFLGVFFVVGLQFKTQLFSFIIGLIGAFASAIAYNTIKFLKGKVNTNIIVLFFPLISLPMAILYAIFINNNWVWPTNLQWFWLVLVGFFTQLGQVSITNAYQMDDLNKLSPISYLGIIWGLLASTLIYNETYTLFQYLGCALVLISVILNFRTQNMAKKYGW